MSQTRRGWAMLCCAAFAAGCCTMAVEMAAARLLAPAFGASQMVWASLIGVVLLALALGYRVGGWLADRKPEARGLFGSMLASGALVALLPLAGRAVDGALGPGGLMSVPVGTVLLLFATMLAAVAPPVFLLAFATPFALRLGVALRPGDEAGRTVGALEAWATAGSIVGTFVPTFVTIPFAGTDQTLLGAAAALVLTGAWGLGGSRWFAGVLLPIVVGLLTTGPVRPRPGLLAEAQTPYQFVQVVRQNGLTEITVNDGAGVQSAWRPGSDLTGMYYDAYTLLPALDADVPAGASPPQPLRVLVLGAGGGTILRQYADLLGSRYRLSLTGVEIDPELPKLAQRYLGLPPAIAADIHVGDARTFLRTAGTYDVIIVDAYADEVYIPFELATSEFFGEVRSHLRSGGVLALNVNALSPSSPLLRSIVRTLRTAFPDVYEAHVATAFNDLVVAAPRPLHAGALDSPGAQPAALRPLASSVAAAWRPAVGAGGRLLTDNRSAIEYLTDLEILHGAEQMDHLG